MKVLTLHQPWASLIALGVKTIETRSWSTQYRGPLAIHAGAATPTQTPIGAYFAFPAAVMGRNTTRWVLRAKGRDGGPDVLPGRRLPLGAIVATCTLVDVVPAADLYWTGLWPRWAWQTSNGGPLYPPQADPVTRDLPVVVPVGQRPYGDFTPGRFAWLFADVVAVDPPVPFKGGQGLTKTWEP